MTNYLNPKTRDEIIKSYNYLFNRIRNGKATDANKEAFLKIKKLRKKISDLDYKEKKKNKDMVIKKQSNRKKIKGFGGDEK